MRYTKQEGIRDCGICCLFNIIKYYNGYIDIEKLRRMTKTNENGTSIYNLVKTSNSLGFKSKSYKCDVDNLRTLTFPLIAFIKVNGFNHFVIITKIDFDKIIVFDPIRGKLTYNLEDFKKVWENIIITFDREGDIVKENNYYKDYILSIFKKYKNSFILLLVISVICSILSLVFSLFLKKIFDNNIKSNTFIIFLFLIIIKIVMDYIKINYSNIINNKINYNLSDSLYKKIFSLPLSFHHNRPIGDISSRFNDLYYIEEYIENILVYGIIDLFLIIIVVFSLLFIKIRLLLLFIFIGVVYIFIYYLLRNKNNLLYQDLVDNYTNNNSLLIDNLLGIDSIKNLNLETRIIQEQNFRNNSYLTSYKKFISFISLQSLLLDFIESYGLILIIYICYIFLNKKQFSLGNLSLVYSLFVIYFNSIKNIVSLDKLFIKSKNSYKRLLRLFNSDINNKEKNIIKDISSISFDNVSYSYDSKKILKNINFNIKKGDFISIYGRSGIGKSSLFKILNKELLEYEGNIYINDKELKTIKEYSLKNELYYSSQNDYLFNDSIRNNIMMYKNISKKEINKAMKVTSLDKLLKNRDISLDYQLVDNGHNVSGGERQIILITRALLKNTNYIILDETTSELDVESERKILERIKSEYNKTIILISHRESNIDLFNKRVEI